MGTGAIKASPGRRHPQARGRARRQVLLQAGRELLAEYDLDQISLPMVAERAGIPASSTYHFYPDLKELYKDLARAIADELNDIVESCIDKDDPGKDFTSWEDIVRRLLTSVQAYFNEDAAARQLLLGPKTNREIKSIGCGGDERFGEGLRLLISRYFELNAFRNQTSVFFRAILVSDLMFCLSVSRHNEINAEYMDEATNAMLAYLSLYIPKLLPRRNRPVLVAATPGAA